MRDVKKFIMEAPAKEIWKEVHKRIVGTELDYRVVKICTLAWLEYRDRRQAEYKTLIRLLNRPESP